MFGIYVECHFLKLEGIENKGVKETASECR